MRRILLLLFIAILSTQACSFAQPCDDLDSSISEYKAGNYDKCITLMKNVVKNDPSESIAYYYLGLSYANKNEIKLAVENYDKVISLSSDKTLKSMAKEGKKCLGFSSITAAEAPLTLDDDSEKISTQLNTGVSKSAPVEKKEVAVVQSIKRPQPVKQNKAPTNDEIVAAIRTLQKAGLYAPGVIPGMQNMGANSNMNKINPKIDSKLLQEQMMMQAMCGNNQNNNNPMAALMGGMGGMNMGGNNSNNLMNMLPYLNQSGNSPQVNQQFIQTMMMSQMMPNMNFSSSDNKDY